MRYNLITDDNDTESERSVHPTGARSSRGGRSTGHEEQAQLHPDPDHSEHMKLFGEHVSSSHREADNVLAEGVGAGNASHQKVGEIGRDISHRKEELEGVKGHEEQAQLHPNPDHSEHMKLFGEHVSSSRREAN